VKLAQVLLDQQVQQDQLVLEDLQDLLDRKAQQVQLDLQ
jgi:hypothetical protein